MSEPQDRPSYRLFHTTVDAIDTSRPTMVRVHVVGDCLQYFGRAGLDQRGQPGIGGELAGHSDSS